MKLTLERKEQADRSPRFGVGETTMVMTRGDYWKYRVMLSDKQAIVGFPKFSTVGIGFAVEDYWNTNLPYTCETRKIFDHISHNKGDDAISDEDCIEAIRLIQQAVQEDK